MSAPSCLCLSEDALGPVGNSGEPVQQDHDLAEDEQAGVGFEGGFPLVDHSSVVVDPRVVAFDDAAA